MAAGTEGFDYPTPDEDDLEAQAATEKALAQERGETDIAASEWLYHPGAKWDVENDPEPHTEDRDALGFKLAWWDEEHGTPPLDIVVAVANHACGFTGYVHDLQRHGYPEGAMPGSVTLDSLSGPLVSAGLQILGTLHPHLRKDVEDVLRQVFDSVPAATPEELEAFEVAERNLAQEAFADAGIPTVTLDEFLSGPDPAEQDAGLN